MNKDRGRETSLISPVVLVGVAPSTIRDAIANNRKGTILGWGPGLDGRDKIPSHVRQGATRNYEGH